MKTPGVHSTNLRSTPYRLDTKESDVDAETVDHRLEIAVEILIYMTGVESTI